MSFASFARSNLTRMAVNATTALQEHELLDAARSGRRGRLQAHRRGAPPAAAGALLPHARLASGRGGRPPGDVPARLARAGRVRRPELASHVALPDRDERLHRRELAEVQADAPDGRRRGLAVERRQPTARRDDLGRALSGRAAGHRRRVCGARSPLRAAGGRRARLHRLAAASAGDPARGPDPARRARLLGQGGCGAARHVRRLGEQRLAAGSQGRRRAASRAEPAGDAAGAR